MNKNIELARFIHKFEGDLAYRKYMTEDHEDLTTRLVAYDIACNSIDWIYFPKTESTNYPEIADKAYKETDDHFLCVEMIEIKNEKIDDKYAELILRSASDVKLMEKYKELQRKI